MQENSKTTVWQRRHKTQTANKKKKKKNTGLERTLVKRSKPNYTKKKKKKREADKTKQNKTEPLMLKKKKSTHTRTKKKKRDNTTKMEQRKTQEDQKKICALLKSGRLHQKRKKHLNIHVDVPIYVLLVPPKCQGRRENLHFFLLDHLITHKYTTEKKKKKYALMRAAAGKKKKEHVLNDSFRQPMRVFSPFSCSSKRKKPSASLDNN